MISPMFFGRRTDPCGDCSDGYCTMNCGPRIEIAPHNQESATCQPKLSLKKPSDLRTETRKAS
jgi:hypothetical protein